MYEFIHQLNYQQQIYEWTYKGLRGIILQVSRLNETHKSLELYILLGNAAMSDKYPGGIEPQPIKLEFKIYPAELWIWRYFGTSLRIYG